MALLTEQGQANIKLGDALRKAEQKLDCIRIQWQDDRSALHRATKSLQKTQQQEEQGWQDAESPGKSQAEDSESRNPKKRENWFQKCFQIPAGHLLLIQVYKKAH